MGETSEKNTQINFSNQNFSDDQQSSFLSSTTSPEVLKNQVNPKRRKRGPSKLKQQIEKLTPNSKVALRRSQTKSFVSFSTLFGNDTNENENETSPMEDDSPVFSTQFSDGTQTSSLEDPSSQDRIGASTPTYSLD